MFFELDINFCYVKPIELIAKPADLVEFGFDVHFPLCENTLKLKYCLTIDTSLASLCLFGKGFVKVRLEHFGSLT